MFKILFLVILGYFFYRLFLVPRTLKGPEKRADIESGEAAQDGEFVEYEELQ